MNQYHDSFSQRVILKLSPLMVLFYFDSFQLESTNSICNKADITKMLGTQNLHEFPAFFELIIKFSKSCQSGNIFKI